MVNKYIILADASNGRPFEKPRQLTEINGEKVIQRTVRLLKENGIKDIIITSHDKRFDNLGATRYEPLHNDYDPENNKGYWLSAFPEELLIEPVCFLFGDVYYSEDAIRRIISEPTESTLLFGTYENNSTKYIKEHDEPVAYKVEDYELFKQKIKEVKEMYDKKMCWRNPLPWELYRHINNMDVCIHQVGENFIKINDETCDVDELEDVDKMKLKMEPGEKKLSIVLPYYKTYELTTKLLNKLIPQLNKDVEVLLIDDGCHESRLDKYKEIEITHLEENKGGAYACNCAIKKAKGKYIGFIDSDDLVSDDYIETLIKAIDEHNEDVIFMDWQDMNTGEITRRPDNYAPWKAIYRREIIPLFDERVIYSFDVPFYDKLNSKPYTRYYIDKILYYYNSNREGNLTTEKEKLLKKQKEENMVKVEVIENFTLEQFDKLEDIERIAVEEKGKLFKGDKFKCEKEMAEYLLGNNPKNKTVVKVVEVEPEEPADQPEEETTQTEEPKVEIPESIEVEDIIIAGAKEQAKELITTKKVENKPKKKNKK